MIFLYQFNSDITCTKMTYKVLLVLYLGSFALFTTVNAIYLDDYDDRTTKDINFLDLLLQHVRNSGEYRRDVSDDIGNWNGRWMPDRPGDPTPPPKVFPNGHSIDDLSQTLHGVAMGKPSKDCDDAKTNLTMDWDKSPVNYTCYDQKIVPNMDTLPLKYCERIPKGYVAIHKCMYDSIQYDSDIPVFGSHRPLWPVYGEYKFLPKQRWLHNLEHGAIVMLYHPCANPLEIKLLRRLVTGCLRRHIISPYNLLPENRPFALLSWGCRLTMSYVNPMIVTRFIHEHALRGPEEVSREGHFHDGLLFPAEIVSDVDDTTLCPNTL